jgi:tetraacyldisaccharide-1-P 4'-kinase
LKLICTEKDFVKITDPELKKQLVVPEHSLQMFDPEKEDLLAQIRKSL